MAEFEGNPAVRFGAFALDPKDATLVGPAGRVRIGRKAMRLLEALLVRPGRLVTKETLLETVWDGTLVTESALTATVKELRRALGDEARNARFIENVYGTGYRFIAPVTESVAEVVAPVADPVPAPAQPRADDPPAAVAPPAVVSRRSLIAGGVIAGAALAATAIAGRAWLVSGEPSPEVKALVSHARQLMGSNLTVGQNEAIGLLRRAVDLAPDFADGWGMLGLAYATKLHFRDPGDRPALRNHAHAAADRALALDPGNALGELAHGFALPLIGHWLERDHRLDRAALARPDDADVLIFVALAMLFDGCASAALLRFDRVGRRLLTPCDSSDYVDALWSVGRIDEAERAAEDAAALYPTQETIWYDRFRLKAFGGNPGAALALLDDATARPLTVDDGFVADLRAQAEAMRAPAAAQTPRTLAHVLAKARLSTFEAEAAVRLASALGDLDTAFAVTDALYFSRGFAVSDSPKWAAFASLDERDTRLLFEPETAPLRADPRFERLVAEIGLDRYWRVRGVVPDYRRGRDDALIPARA